MISLSELAKKLSCEKKVALFCHVRPDGDTIGSAFALKLSLQSLGVEVEVYSEDAVPERFSFFGKYRSSVGELLGAFTSGLGI